MGCTSDGIGALSGPVFTNTEINRLFFYGKPITGLKTFDNHFALPIFNHWNVCVTHNVPKCALSPLPRASLVSSPHRVPTSCVN
jgi:hypothetical protein